MADAEKCKWCDGDISRRRTQFGLTWFHVGNGSPVCPMDKVFRAVTEGDITYAEPVSA